MYIADGGEATTWTGDDGESEGWGEYLQEWPTVPKGAVEGKDGEPYTVKIDTDGKITVTVGEEVIVEEGTTPDGQG